MIGSSAAVRRQTTALPVRTRFVETTNSSACVCEQARVHALDITHYTNAIAHTLLVMARSDWRVSSAPRQNSGGLPAEAKVHTAIHAIEDRFMTPLFKKLNLTTQDTVHVLHAPASFEPEVSALRGVTVKRSVSGHTPFAIAFVVTQAELDKVSTTVAKFATGDAIVWMAYPKSTSKRYRCEFNRDTGWTVLGAAGFEPVRQVAIDEDWSALRFRRVEHIATMKRNPKGAISKAGRAKARAGRTARPSSRRRKESDD